MQIKVEVAGVGSRVRPNGLAVVLTRDILTRGVWLTGREKVSIRKIMPGVLAALLIYETAHAQPCPMKQVTVGRGYESGGSCNEMPEAAFRAYFLGVLDGLTISPIAGAERSCLDFAIGCTESLGSTQLRAVARKYIRDNPQMWDSHCAISIYNSLQQFCQSRRP